MPGITKCRAAVLAGAAFWMLAGTTAAMAGDAAAPAPYAALGDAGKTWGMLNQYCVKCHNFEQWSGGVAFDTTLPDEVPNDPALWEKVVMKLRGRLMPPVGQPRPSEQTYGQFVSWLEGYLDEAGARRPDPGSVPLHRLNRKEYANAIRDLLDLKIDGAALLPEDDVSDGFDNVADVLHVSPAFFSQYVSAARSVAEEAVGEAAPHAGSSAYFLPADAEGKQWIHVEVLPFGTRGGLVVEHLFPADGDYVINIRDMIGDGDIYFLGVEFENTVLVTLDGKEVFRTVVGGDADHKAVDQQQSPAVDAINARLKNIHFKATAGPHKVGVTFLHRSYAESDGRLHTLSAGGGMDRLARVAGFEVRGPFNPTGLTATPSRKRLFSCYPKTTVEEQPCAEEIIKRVASAAYRRPVNDSDMGFLMPFYAAGYKAKGFEEGIRTALTRILASPNFLFRSETPDRPMAAGKDFRLNDLALASRLSFFLWSTIPDQELLGLASAGRLHEKPVLEAQVKRMLADPRSKTLASDFAFQWLDIGKIDEVDPDPDVFPQVAPHRKVVGVDGEIRDEFRTELAMFIDSVFREDRNVLDLLRADYTYLNEPLALQYGIDTVKGSRFRRVTLQDSARWGLLGKGAVLMVSSYPNRTAPVLRGAWILDNLLGTPPAAPPANVMALLEDNPVGAKQFLTVRQRLKIHAEEPSCNACHGILDPLGFSLENFDAVGAWRDVEIFSGTPVDTVGELPDGTVLNGPDDLRKALIARSNQFVQTLTQRLMTYALGRSIQYYDMPTVRGIVRDLQKKDYRFSALVMDIVESDAFQMKRVAAPEKTSSPAREALNQ